MRDVVVFVAGMTLLGIACSLLVSGSVYETVFGVFCGGLGGYTMADGHGED